MLEPHMYTEEEWRRMIAEGNPFAMHILEEG